MNDGPKQVIARQKLLPLGRTIFSEVIQIFTKWTHVLPFWGYQPIPIVRPTADEVFVLIYNYTIRKTPAPNYLQIVCVSNKFSGKI